MNRLHKFIFPKESTQLNELLQLRELGTHLPLPVQLARLDEASGDLFNKLVALGDYQQSLEVYNDGQRKSDCEYCWQMYYTNNTYKGVADRTLDYGLGKSVQVISSSNDVVVQETLSAVRNKAVFGVMAFRHMGLSFLNESEVMFVLWYDESTGLTTIQRLQTYDMKIVWADTLTKTVPLVYLVNSEEGTIAYRDWRTQDDMLNTYLSENEDVILASDMESNILGLNHVAVWAVGTNRHITSGRGLPTYISVTKNAEYLSQFDDQRFAVSSESAKYTAEYTVDGGSKDLQDFINRESDNYAPYGSAYASNTAVEREWQNNPTGANSERFNQHVWTQGISAATSLNGAQLGIPSMLSNRSVLDKLHETFIEAIEAFQNIVADVLKDVFNVVTIISSNANVIGTPELFEQQALDLRVNLDTPLNIDIDQATTFIDVQRKREDITPEEQERLTMLEKLVYDKFGVVVIGQTATGSTNSSKPQEVK